MPRRPLAVFLAALTAFQPVVPAFAQSTGFTIKVPMAVVSFQPTTQSFNFGNVAVGSRPVRTFIFANKSTSALTISGITNHGAAAIDSNNCPATLAAGAACNISVALPVTAESPYIGEVRVQTGASGTPEILRVTATGTAQASAIEATPTAVTFGEVAVGSSSSPSTITLKNVSGSDVNLGDMYLAENTSYFNLSSSCDQVLAAGASCTVSVRFTPRLVGSTQTRLVRDAEDGTQLFVASFSGAGVRAESTWSVTQANFLDVPVGQKSEIQEIGLTNTGRGSLVIDRLAIAGDASFRLEGHSCGAKVEPSQSCIVRLSVTPPDNFVRSATLKLDSASLELRSSSVQLYSRPQVAEAVLSLSPGSLDFGDVTVGATSATRTVTIKSTGNAAVGVVNYSLGGTNTADFTIQNPSNCIGLLAPGSQCVLNIVGNPKSPGARSATLRVTSSSSQPVTPVALAVRGVQGSVAAAPNPVAFGEIEVATNKQVTVTAVNNGTAPVTLTAPSVSGANSGLFSVAGCVNQTLAPSASCQITVTYAPNAAGSHSANLNLPNNGNNPSFSVPITGSAKAVPPAGGLSDFTCPDVVAFGTTASCTATLSNTGSVNLTFNTLGSSNPAFSLSSNCPTNVAPGSSCSVTANVSTGGAPASGTASFTANVTVNTSAGPLTKPASITAETSKISLTIGAYGPVTAGTSGTATHTVRNTGRLPVNFTTAPILGALAPAGGFVVGNNACSGPLAPQASCNIEVRCVVPAGSSANQTGTLTVAGSNSATAVGNLACQGFVPVTAANLSITPNPLSYGGVQVGTGLTRAVTVENKNTVAVQLSEVLVEGANSAEFSIIGPRCASVPAATGATPGRCSMNVEFRPRAGDIRTATITVKSAASNIQASAVLSGTGQVSTLTATPNPVVFAPKTLNSGATVMPVQVRNTGPGAVTLPAVTAWTKTGSAEFSIVNTSCAGATVAANATCAFGISFNPTSLGAKSGSISITGSNFNPLNIAFNATATTAPAPIAALGALTCVSPTPVNGQSACTAVLSNTGNAPLTVGTGSYAVNNDPRSFGTTLPAGASRTPTCLSATNASLTSLTPGQSCTFRFNAAITRAGDNTVQFLQKTNGGDVYSTAMVTAVSPAVTLATTNHPATAIGARSNTTHTITNTGSIPFNLNNPALLITGSPSILVSGTPAGGVACPITLQPGQSCQVQTTCSPLSTTPLESTLRVNALSGNPTASGAVKCSGAAPGLSVVLAGPQTTEAGAWSNSGNFFRATNTGAGPLTVSTLTAGGPNWQIVVNSRDASHCTAGKVLQSGESCLFLSMMANGTPGSNESVSHRVRMLSGTTPVEVLVRDGFRHQAVDVVATRPFANVQSGVPQEAVYTVTNQAPYDLSSVNVTLAGAPTFTLVGQTCQNGLKAAGQPNSSCTVTLRLAPTNTLASTTTLTVNGSYPQVINGTAQAPVRSGVQKAVNISVTAVAPRLTFIPSVYAPVPAGQTAVAVHTVRNDGAGPVTLTTNATVTPAQFSVNASASTCRPGLVLNPAESCVLSIGFTPTAVSAGTTTGTVSQPATGVNAVGPIAGLRTLPGDMVVTVTDNKTTMVKGTQTMFVGTIRNQSAAAVTISAVTNASAIDGASITASSPVTCSGFPFGGSCVVNGTSAQITLPANSFANLSQTLTAGAGLGKLKFDVSATVAGITETNVANNNASDTTDVINPTVDFSITASGMSGTRATDAPNGTITLTIRNNTNAADPAAFKDVAVGSARVTDFSHMNLQLQSCTAVTPGASCSIAGDSVQVRLRPGQSVNALYAFSTPITEGTSRLSARVDAFTDYSEPIVTNNIANLSAVIKNVPTVKRCMFATQVNSEFLGCVSGFGAFGCQTSTASVDWFTWNLTDGWTQVQGPVGLYWKKPDFSRGQATWKGTNQKVEPLVKTISGVRYSYIAYPVAQIFERGVWTDHYLSFGAGGSTLAFWVDGPSPGAYYTDSPTVRGRAKVIGGGFNGVHNWYNANSPAEQYRSAGIDINGVQYRQTWEENSLGANCAVPGTIKLVRDARTGAWNPAP